MIKRTVLALMLIGVALFAISHAQEANNAVETLLESMEDARGDDLWQIAGQLEAMGRAAIPDLQDAQRRANPYIRLGSASALYGLGKKKDAVAGILTVLKGKDDDARIEAAHLLASLTRDDFGYGSPDDIKKEIKELIDANKDERTQVALYRATLAIDQDIRAVRKLRSLVEAADPEAAADAALTLAEISQYEAAEPVLKRLAKEPTDRGRAAQAYLLNFEMSKKMKAMSAPDREYKNDYGMLEEIFDLLDEFYYDESKVNRKDLIDGAAFGIGNALDPFSSYLDEEGIAALEEDLTGKYAGIGARVSMRPDDAGNNWLTIEQPIYSGPAYKAGLRTLDRITEIEGETAVNKDLSELVRLLRGEPGTEVKIMVYRRGWQDEREFTLTRAAITMQTTKWDLLPGGIGYASLATFGPNTAAELLQGVKEMQGEGMKGLILDLRGNPGGLLRAAVGVCDVFLPTDKEVVSIIPKDKTIRDSRKTESPAAGDFPVVVLINGSSASASEIVSGALQDHERATIIGERSYGKGSVQNIFRLKSRDEKTGLRATIALYYLPSGRSIHRDKDTRGGVEPDEEVLLPLRDFWKEAEFDNLRTDGVVESWLRQDDRFKKNQDLFMKLANDDGKDLSKYPGFDDLYTQSGTKLTKEEFRELVREYVRRWAADINGKDWSYDLQTDLQLQAAIRHIAGKTGVDMNDHAVYKTFDPVEDTNGEGNGKSEEAPKDE
jgi:carboxyl-terminal processing protease